MKKSYYTLTTNILPGWPLPRGGHRIEQGEIASTLGSRLADAGAWKDPPHVALANLGYDPAKRGGFASEKAIVSFLKQYGPLGARPEEVGEPGEPFWLRLASFHEMQERLREAWKKRDHRFFVDPSRLKGGTGYEHLLRVNWEMKGGMLVMRLATWYDYVAILLTRDIVERRARICGNPNCVTPYFVAERRDAKYCSHPCAVAVSVRRFRERKRRKKK
ncbi:MAG TPA: hypothetical protein VK728_10010 [Candidatus Sulfotelmatobacter sp.]|jgi:hypothetical protein|nr:hypothetical protein [Candidatus Sulfotelmatobacter sp.]